MKPNFPNILFILFLLSFSAASFGLDNDEKVVIAAIKAGDTVPVNNYLVHHPDPNCPFSNGKTGLYYAIESDITEMARFLLKKGADPEFLVEGISTMKWAIKSNNERIVRYLVEYGADVNRPDEKKNTPLIYAAELNRVGICKILVDRGANPLHENQNGKRASDFAYNYAESPAYEYLVFMEEQAIRQDSVPSMHDGPYISWEGDSRVVMTYYEHDQQKQFTRLFEKTIDVGSRDTVVRGLAWDKNRYPIKHGFFPDPDSISTTGKIFVVGDIHGKYNALVTLLINNNIIDSSLNWTFGDGHLVLLGDVFDRGAHVTEALWLLYELDVQANEAGGAVCLLLGNHEIMALTGDHRYLNNKYIFFFQYTQVYYYQLFDNNSLMGRWLRSQNLIMRINDNLFVHAGISPQFAGLHYSLNEINQRIRDYLNSDLTIAKGSPEDIILGAIGPQWYRGYGPSSSGYPELTQQFVDDYMREKALKTMIFGHNAATDIITTFNGKVISADVEIDENELSSQGLLISGDKLFRCLADGTQVQLQ